MKDKSLSREFDDWKKENKQHGRQAFSRFIMLKFLDAISNLSDEFIFKGGNLLWHYIKTPRQTIDLDLATVKLNSHIQVREVIEKTQSYYPEINFFIKDFVEVNEEPYLGSSIIIGFTTQTGQKNQFNIDIVYSLPTDFAMVKSTISLKYYKSASIENIITDKIKAAYRFKGGNTRMKDFDDLWRISKSKTLIDKLKLSRLMKDKGNVYCLDTQWIEFLQSHWKRHAKSYKDIPGSLEQVFNDINSWLKKLDKK